MIWAEELGLGELGLMPEEFWSLTVPEFYIKHRAFMRAEQRAEWLVGRHALLTTRFEKGKAPKTVTQFLGYRQMDRYPIKPWHSPKPPKR